MRMNASWNVRHECGLLRLGEHGVAGLRRWTRPGAAARRAATWVCTRWSAITRFMNRKQRSASASASRCSSPSRELAAATFRASLDRVQALVAQVLRQLAGPASSPSSHAA